jgi:uncharacterized protein
MTKKHATMLWVGLLAAWPVLSLAQQQTGALTAAERDRLEVMQQVLSQPEVAWKHPDLRYRGLGADAYKDGDKPRALAMFTEAARYGDKPSQAMVATMYWNGEGTDVDRPRAYAWMDLAADRGYSDLLLQREAYWARLSADERDKALTIGQQIYAEYSDEQGEKRLALQLKAQTRVTGSHVGYVGNGITTRALGGLLTMDRGAGRSLDTDVYSYQLGTYYSSAVWNPADYLNLKDVQWRMKGPLRGNVDIGAPVPVSNRIDAQPPA